MSPARKWEVLICGAQFDQELKSGKMTALDLAPAAKRLGAQGVEYREVYWKDKANELPAVRDQLAQLGLKRTYATFTTLYNRDPEKQKTLMRDLEDAHALGAPHMRVFRGELPGDGPDGAAMRDATRAVIDRAGELGMRLALENYRGVPGNQMTDVLETIEQLNSPVMGANIDTSNYALNNQDPVKAARLLAPWIIYCHLKDSRPGIEATFPGNGTLDLRGVFAAFDETGRTFPICFEFPGEGDPERGIRKGLEFIESL